MDKLGIKGTLYDFLGYVIPGLTFIVGLVALFAYKENSDISAIAKNFLDVKVGVVASALILITAYILGHIFASLSSILFERRGKNLSLKKHYEIDPKQVGEKFRTYYEKIFGNDSEIEFRNVIAYSEEKTKAVYDTAFVFLSIYGFSRNTSMALFFVLIANFIVLDYTAWNVWVILGLILGIVALIHNYLRFREYYVKQIFASLTVPLD